LSVGAMINGSNILFDASVGPLGIFVRNGIVCLDNGTPNQPAAWIISLKTQSPDHRWLLSDIGGQVVSKLTGQVHVDVPVYFPTENDLVGHLRVDVGDLSDPFKTLTSSTPDFASKITQMNLESVFDSVADGWDGVIHLLRDALRSKLAANKIPLVGAQIQHALDFLQDLDQRVQAELMKAPHLAAQVVQKALNDALGAKGLG